MQGFRVSLWMSLWNMIFFFLWTRISIHLSIYFSRIYRFFCDGLDVKILPWVGSWSGVPLEISSSPIFLYSYDFIKGQDQKFIESLSGLLGQHDYSTSVPACEWHSRKWQVPIQMLWGGGWRHFNWNSSWEPLIKVPAASCVFRVPHFKMALGSFN